MPVVQAAVFCNELAALLERFKNAAQIESGLPRLLMHVGFVEDAGCEGSSWNPTSARTDWLEHHKRLRQSSSMHFSPTLV